MKTILITKTIGSIALLILTQLAAYSQGHGMPAEAHDNIRSLFDSHDQFQREVTETKDGYLSITTSNDPDAVKVLQSHVKQMETRLKEGLMVRRWDPAYEEFVNHYDDIDIIITNVPNGISITATGATEEAKEVARNHAGIISQFVKSGWAEHDKTHAAVFSSAAPLGKRQGKACCLTESETSKSPACCSGPAQTEPKACFQCSEEAH